MPIFDGILAENGIWSEPVPKSIFEIFDSAIETEINSNDMKAIERVLAS